MAYYNGKKVLSVFRAGASATVDDVLSETSENAVQNKVLTKSMKGVTVCKLRTTSVNTTVTLQNLTNMVCIDWGDGTVDKLLTHTYEAAGYYDVYIFGATEIGANAFQNNTYLREISIADGIKSIGNNAFSGCTNLTSCVMPNSVTSIGNNAFKSCYNYTAAFHLSDNLLQIGSSAFYGASFRIIDVPEGVYSIGGGAFASNANYTAIIFRRTSPVSITSNTFTNTGTCPIYVPKSALASYKAAQYWSAISSRIVAIADSNDLAGKQDLLTAGTGISIVGNVISATGGGGGGSAWNEIDGGSNTQITSYAFSVNKKYEIFAMAYHPMISDLTPMSTPPFVLDTDSSIAAVNLYVNPAFQTGATGDQQLEVAPNIGQWSPIYFQWVLASDKSASGWKIKVYYRELDVASPS